MTMHPQIVTETSSASPKPENPPISPNEITVALNDLPSLPKVLSVLRQQIDENAAIEAIADSLSRDQALSAKALRLANSSFYGMQGKIATISQAIVVLGINQVEILVTAAAISNSFTTGKAGTFNFQLFWRHAAATALCARALARHSSIHPGEAFIAGLLHDIGRLVLATHFMSHYQCVMKHVQETGCSLLQAEQALLGTDHVVVGAALASQWKFPVAIQEAVALHHSTTMSDQPPMVRNTFAADRLVHAYNLHQPTPHPDPEPNALEALQSLHIDAALQEAVVSEVMLQFDDVCKVFAS